MDDPGILVLIGLVAGILIGWLLFRPAPSRV